MMEYVTLNNGVNKLRGSQGIGGIVGTAFDLISNCTATADITVAGDGGAYTDAVVGDPVCAVSVDCQSDVSIVQPLPDAA